MINVQKMKEENEEESRKKQKDRIKARYDYVCVVMVTNDILE